MNKIVSQIKQSVHVHPAFSVHRWCAHCPYSTIRHSPNSLSVSAISPASFHQLMSVQNTGRQDHKNKHPRDTWQTSLNTSWLMSRWRCYEDVVHESKVSKDGRKARARAMWQTVGYYWFGHSCVTNTLNRKQTLRATQPNLDSLPVDLCLLSDI
jgi:hypothetical protein